MSGYWVAVPDRHETNCKHSSWVSSLVFNNNLTLLRCEYMCAGTLVHIPRHLSKTSDNNKRCQLIIHCMFCNSGRINLVYDDMRYMVYGWGFPCLNYSFDVLISWSHKLGLYRWCCRICFYRVLYQIFGLWSLLYYSCLDPALPLVFYPPVFYSYLIIP